MAQELGMLNTVETEPSTVEKLLEKFSDIFEVLAR
jgi:hypothetical protein